MWVPPKVSQELREKSRQYAAQVESSLVRDSTLERFDRDLKAIDHRLYLIKAKESVIPGTALKPGYWHIIRDNESAPPTVMTIEGPDGEYIEPDSGVFERLRANDLWREDVRRDRKRKVAELEERERKMEAEEDRLRQEEIWERWLAASRVGVSMNDSTPWSQNVKGRR